MKMIRFAFAALAVALISAPAMAQGIVTSLGTVWDTEPDAWTRGTTADSSYYGWDNLESSGVPLAFGTLLDDSTPDLGVDPGDARFFQGTDGLNDNGGGTFYGHRSSSGNFYTGFPVGPPGTPFNPNPAGTRDVDDTFTGVTPASGPGGNTTLLVQILGQPGNPVPGIEFVASAGWTQTSDLYGLLADGTGIYWQEWTAPGANLSFSVDIDGPFGTTDYALDAFQIDSFWSDGAAVLNSRTSVGVPEPASFALLGLASIAAFARRRRA